MVLVYYSGLDFDLQILLLMLASQILVDFITYDVLFWLQTPHYCTALSFTLGSLVSFE